LVDTGHRCRRAGEAPTPRDAHRRGGLSRIGQVLKGPVCPRSRWAFANAVIVIAGELTLGVLEGIALGVVVSLLTLIYVTSHPHGAVLGQLPDTEAYRNVQRHPEAITFPGLLILRIGGDLFFASVGHVSEALKASLAASLDGCDIRQTTISLKYHRSVNNLEHG
jgi:MFS superfamily sulfate permease-like transporter